MPIPSTGPISLQTIATEFGGGTPHSISEYYAGAGLVYPGTTGNLGVIPSSGTVSFDHYRGSAAVYPIRDQANGSGFVTQGNHGSGAWASATLSLGTPAADRSVVVMIWSEHARAGRCLVAGVEATLLKSYNGGIGNYTSIWIAKIGNTGGTSGTVQWQVASGTDSRRSGWYTHIVYNPKQTPVGAVSGGSSVATLDGGIAFLVGSSRFGSATTPAGWTSVYSYVTGEGLFNFCYRLTPAGTVSISSPTSGSYQAYSAASLTGEP